MIMRILTLSILFSLAQLSIAFSPYPSRTFLLANRVHESADIINSPSSWTPVHRFNTVSPLFMAVYESVGEITTSSKDRMQKCIESVKKNLQTIRTGRANPAILDRVVVDYWGTPTPINQLASIAVSSAQQLTVSPFDKSSSKSIEAAIIDSGLGLTPNNDGTVIRINIPAITEARRKELMKQCKSIGEEGKIAVRNVRRDGVEAIKKLEKDKAVGEDESKTKQDELQKMTDKFVKEIDSVIASKEKEVMTV